MRSNPTAYYPASPLDDAGEFAARLLAVCGEAIGVRTGMAIEGLRLLKSSAHGHFTYRFDYVWSRGREPLVIRLFRSDLSPWARSDPPSAKARREFATLSWLVRRGFPVPNPIWLDAEGPALDAPALLSRAMPGRHWDAEWDTSAEAAEAAFKRMAFMQARLHAVDGGEWPGRGRLPTLSLDTVLTFLSDLVTEVDHEPSETLLDTVRGLRSAVVEIAPVLVHGDFQLDNLRFEYGEISAVVDWEAAVWADPRWDVAYTRCGLGAYSGEFLATYERARGEALSHIDFWDALVATRAAILRRWHARDASAELAARYLTRTRRCERIAEDAIARFRRVAG